MGKNVGLEEMIIARRKSVVLYVLGEEVITSRIRLSLIRAQRVTLLQLLLLDGYSPLFDG